MVHRTVNQAPGVTPEIEKILEAVLLQALDIAREKLDAGELLVPFTALAVGETLFTETHPSEDPDECFKMAQHTVQNARGALAYAFCYDGYVETDKGELDAIIAEGGVPGSEIGHAVGYLYTVAGEDENLSFTFEEEPIYIGQAPNFMEFTLIVDEDELNEEESNADTGELPSSDAEDTNAENTGEEDIQDTLEED